MAFLILTVVVICDCRYFLTGGPTDESWGDGVRGSGESIGYAAVIVGFWIVAAFLAEALAGLAIGRLALRDDGLGVRLGALVLGSCWSASFSVCPTSASLIGFVIFILASAAFALAHRPNACRSPVVRARSVQQADAGHGAIK